MRIANDQTRLPNGKNYTARAYLSERKVAERLGMSAKWLQKMRQVGGGIKYSKFGNAVRYPIEEIEAYEERSLRRHISQESQIAVRERPENEANLCSIQSHIDHIPIRSHSTSEHLSNPVSEEVL